MSVSPRLPTAVRLVLASFACVWLTAVAADDFVTLTSSSTFTVDRPEDTGRATLMLAHPDGRHSRIDFNANEAVVLDADRVDDLDLADGQYIWEVRFAPLVKSEATIAAEQTRHEQAQDGAKIGETIESKSGALVIADGAFTQAPAGDNEPMSTEGSDAGARDVVHTDDLIVQASLCTGGDCIDGESFGSDTIRLKENNLQIHFDDTSDIAGYAANDWRLVANDSASGGVNHFTVQDATAGRSLFRLMAGAPNNAFFMDNSGQVGLSTATPAQDLHIAQGDTPTVRLEQTTAAGFNAQTWDVAGNEANFFIRDVTGGSELPFRIRPGAPQSSIDIAGSGRVGIGTPSPAAKLHVADGDLRVDGAVYQLSSRSMKTPFSHFDPGHLLELVEGLDLGVWRYLSKPEGGKHFGPAAEDFHEAFGLGERDDSISIADMAGIALGAAQALKQEVDKRDAEIDALHARLDRLERALEMATARKAL